MPRNPNEIVARLSYEDILALHKEHGSERRAAAALGVPRTSLQDRLRQLKQERFTTQKMVAPLVIEPQLLTRVLIVTSAQDATAVHLPFLRNLEAYATYRKGQLVVSGFTYNKSLFEDHDKAGSWFAPEIAKYLEDRQIHVGDGLSVCCEMNTLPTAVNPLSGFEAYTGDRWGIFPHPKVQLKSIPTAKGDDAKIIMTTGAVTLPNYVQKKAGIKAEHLHEVGAVIIEMLPTGEFFVRHLLAEDNGSFQDLVHYVHMGQVINMRELHPETAEHRRHTITPGAPAAPVGNFVEAITWGDIHHEKRDEAIFGACWGNVGTPPKFMPMIEYLRPRLQFEHDVSDFEPRNHHNIKDPHFRFKMHIRGTESVKEAITGVARFIEATRRPWCTTIVVESNHDLALLRWLKTADYRDDPVNAPYFLELQSTIYKAIESGHDKFQILPWALHELADLDGVIFLSEDDSYTIAGGIECSLHGHLGANGAKASPQQFARMGKPSNTAHTHAAGIYDGNYTAGVSGKKDMGYNTGLSSWSHSHILTYGNSKRTIITMLPDGRYCADIG